MDGSNRYIAFISYRHEPLGRKWAMWLHRAIEGYRVPGSLVKTGRAPRRVGKVFRDEEELAASADLSKEIDAALVQSKFLIVICTPRTPHSKWVNQEIQRFRDLGRGDRILALLVEGEPRESFPPALVEIRRSSVESVALKDAPVDEVEPLAADVRDGVRALAGHSGGHARALAKLRLLSALLGVRFDDLRNRELRRAHGRIVIAGVLALLLAGVFGGLGFYALGQKVLADSRLAELVAERDEKERQRAEAQRQSQEALRQAAIAELNEARAREGESVAERALAELRVTLERERVQRARAEHRVTVAAGMADATNAAVRIANRVGLLEPNLPFDSRSLDAALVEECGRDEAMEAMSLSYLVYVTFMSGRLDAAKHVFERAVRAYEREGVLDSPSALALAGEMVKIGIGAGSSPEWMLVSDEFIRRVLAAQTSRFGRSDHRVLETFNVLARRLNLRALDEIEAARGEKNLDAVPAEERRTAFELVELCRDRLGDVETPADADEPIRADAKADFFGNLAWAMEQVGDFAGAQRYRRLALENRRLSGDGGWRMLAMDMEKLAGNLLNLGYHDEAAMLLEDAVQHVRDDRQAYIIVLGTTARNLLAWAKRTQDPASVRRARIERGLEICDRIETVDPSDSSAASLRTLLEWELDALPE